ncbi:hypothetical protein B0H16DRAFT_1695443 [Mycena metata]|uniref:Uncharacterized protein n=1 Tax=Mycena metata TaxID=1033252 RepID=A0AAD7MXA2_9AGAR|nr:hypothetical protein B0H16DRAFT_1695443 [Mycena metata]
MFASESYPPGNLIPPLNAIAQFLACLSHVSTTAAQLSAVVIFSEEALSVPRLSGKFRRPTFQHPSVKVLATIQHVSNARLMFIPYVGDYGTTKYAYEIGLEMCPACSTCARQKKATVGLRISNRLILNALDTTGSRTLLVRVPQEQQKDSIRPQHVPTPNRTKRPLIAAFSIRLPYDMDLCPQRLRDYYRIPGLHTLLLDICLSPLFEGSQASASTMCREIPFAHVSTSERQSSCSSHISVTGPYMFNLRQTDENNRRSSSTLPGAEQY